MMVKITRGYYGHRNGRIVELKDVNTPAFEVQEEEAKRIIGLGIAKADVVSEDEQEHINESGNVTGHLTEEQLRELPYSRLKKLCKEMGVSAAGKQDELIARLLEVEVEVTDQDEEKEVAETDESDNEECPPMLTPAEPEE